MGILGQLLVGSGVSVVNIAIHGLVMTSVVGAARLISRREYGSQRMFLPFMMVGVVSILMSAHIGEVMVWAAAYSLLGAAPAGADPIYFAFVNYTTLGYGDVVPVKEWQLLGPSTALNGVLMIGWSTAVIFEVLRRSLDIGEPHR